MHVKKNILKHQDLIHAIMLKIKPGLCSLCMQFNKDMISDYLLKLKYESMKEYSKYVIMSRDINSK